MASGGSPRGEGGAAAAAAATDPSASNPVEWLEPVVSEGAAAAPSASTEALNTISRREAAAIRRHLRSLQNRIGSLATELRRRAQELMKQGDASDVEWLKARGIRDLLSKLPPSSGDPSEEADAIPSDRGL